MDFFDRRILAVLKDGKSRNFQRILSEVGSSYNTLRLRLVQLVEQGLVVRRKRPQEGQGRPRFAYSLFKGVDGRTVSALLDPYKGWWFSPSRSYGVSAIKDMAVHVNTLLTKVMIYNQFDDILVLSSRRKAFTRF